MKFFTTAEILYSLFLSGLFGIFFGSVYVATEKISVAFLKTLRLVPSVIASLNNFSVSEARKRLKKANAFRMNSLIHNILEFVFFLIFGIALILLFYIALDGVFRVYILIAVIAFFVISMKTVGNMFADLFDRIFSFIYAILFYFLAVLFLPWYITAKHIVKYICRLTKPLRDKKLKKRSERLIKRKIREAENVF